MISRKSHFEKDKKIEAFALSGKLVSTLPARIQISMFNQKCSGEYLSAIVKWLYIQGIKNVEFQIADTLQRHNFFWKLKRDEQYCLKMAIKAGHDWVDDNRNTICDSFTHFDKVIITSWNHWLSHPDHKIKEQKLWELMETDELFRQAIYAEINNYLELLNRRKTQEREKKSLDFLLEEIAVSEISSYEGTINEIYPGPRFIPEIHLKQNYPEEFSLSQMNFVHVDFTTE